MLFLNFTNQNTTQNATGINYRGQLLVGSRQASSNASEGGGINRESSLDDSGVVDDHYEQDLTGNELLNASNVEVSAVQKYSSYVYKKKNKIIFVPITSCRAM